MSDHNSLANRVAQYRSQMRWLIAAVMFVGAISLLLLMNGASSASGAIADMGQCAWTNGVGTNPNQYLDCTQQTGGNGWVPGLVGNKSDYYSEGMAVPERVWMNSLTAGQHVLKFYASFSNGINHGMDYLVSISETQELALYYSGIPARIDACAKLPKTGNPSDQDDCRSVYGISGSTHVTIPLGTDPYVSSNGVPDSSVGNRQTAFDNFFGAGKRFIDVYGTNAITVNDFFRCHTANPADTDACLANSSDGTGSWTRYVITFTTTGASSSAGFFFGAHLALSGNQRWDDMSWGYTYGAGSINGASWHVKNPSIDGTGGSQDNQMGVSTGTMTPFGTTPSRSLASTGQTITDSLNISPTIDNSTVQGTVSWFLCADTVTVYTPTISSALQFGCLPPHTRTAGIQYLNTSLSGTNGQTYTVAYIGDTNMTGSGGNNNHQGNATSPNVSIAQYGSYCWLAIVTPTVESGLTRNYPPAGDSSISECFVVNSGSTAVKLSSLDAVSSNTTAVPSADSFPVAVVFLGLLGLVAVGGIVAFGYKRNKAE